MIINYNASEILPESNIDVKIEVSGIEYDTTPRGKIKYVYYFTDYYIVVNGHEFLVDCGSKMHKQLDNVLHKKVHEKIMSSWGSIYAELKFKEIDND